MKIAITSKDKNLDSHVDDNLGRAAYILIVDSNTLDFEAIDNNKNTEAKYNTNINIAKLLCQKGVTFLLTGFCGPRAYELLEVAKVKVIHNMARNCEITVAELLANNKHLFAETAKY